LPREAGSIHSEPEAQGVSANCWFRSTTKNTTGFMRGIDNLRNADEAYHAASSQTHGHTNSVQGSFAGLRFARAAECLACATLAYSNVVCILTQIAGNARLVPISNSSVAPQHSGCPPADPAPVVAASRMCLQFTQVCSMFHSIYSLYLAASPHFDPAILRCLVCPLTKGDLRWASSFGLHCLLLSRAR